MLADVRHGFFGYVGRNRGCDIFLVGILRHGKTHDRDLERHLVAVAVVDAVTVVAEIVHNLIHGRLGGVVAKLFVHAEIIVTALAVNIRQETF